MNPSDLLAAPFRFGASLRRGRFFHPSGILAHGFLERLAPPGSGLPVDSCAVVARVSKGVGTPGSLPDFAGLAVQIPPNAFAATPWDLLLVSAGLGSAVPASLDRLLLRPVTSWSQAPYSSLMPLRLSTNHDDRLWWVRAQLCTPVSGGLDLGAARDALGAGSLVYEFEQSCGNNGFEPLARLTLDAEMSGPGADLAFDPVRHSAPGVAVWPGWLRELRESAYRGSRQGRDMA